MDKVQVYYIFLLIVGFIGTLVGFVNVKDVEDLAKKVVTYFITLALSIPVAGRIFGWW